MKSSDLEQRILRFVAEHKPVPLPRMIEELKENEQEVRRAAMRLLERGIFVMDYEFRLSTSAGVGEQERADVENSLRHYCVDPGDLDATPWCALVDALYQKYGAGAEAHDFSEFCKHHERWFEIAAAAHATNKRSDVAKTTLALLREDSLFEVEDFDTTVEDMRREDAQLPAEHARRLSGLRQGYDRAVIEVEYLRTTQKRRECEVQESHAEICAALREAGIETNDIAAGVRELSLRLASEGSARQWGSASCVVEPKLCTTDARICEACLDGIGYQCHVPGCCFFLCGTPRTDLGTLRSRFEGAGYSCTPVEGT